MNFPVWEVELGGGLLVALVAVTHVFISHFAVGGGLFLAVTERRARSQGDTELLAYVERHSKFFALLTLVTGALTGVGIWFVIGLVHPAATSALIHIFVWAWAIEWVLFFVEIAAAIIYARTWRTLDARTHLRIGWIYFWAAFLSLVVINGILSFMLTPGAWLESHSFWDGFFNPTYLPSLVVRTLGCIAFAGLYVFITAWREAPELRVRLARWGSLWAVAATVAGPLAAYRYVGAVGDSAWDAVRVAVPKARLGLTLTVGSVILYVIILVVILALVRRRPGVVSLPVGVLLLVSGYGSIAGAELVRENLRKPFVIGAPTLGGYMYVNGIRTTDLARSQADGALQQIRWPVTPEPSTPAALATGRDLFRVVCRGCHALHGYNAIAPLVADKPVKALEATVRTLDVRRGRMPPFPGSEAEVVPLARYLASLDGVLEPFSPSDAAPDKGRALLEEHCLSCHSVQSDKDDPPALLPKRIAGWSADKAYEELGRLSKLNEEMPDFQGDDAARRELAVYLAALAAKGMP